MFSPKFLLLRLLPLLAVVIGVGFLYGKYEYRQGRKAGEAAQKAAYEEASQKALIMRLQENAVIAQHYAQQAQKAATDHEQELKAVRDTVRTSISQRVPVSADFCRAATGAPESSQASSDGQAAAGTAFLPEPFAGDLRELAADADETLADLRHLVRRAEEAGCFQ